MVPHSLQHNTTTRSSARATAPSATVIGGLVCAGAAVGREPREQAIRLFAFLRTLGSLGARALRAEGDLALVVVGGAS